MPHSEFRVVRVVALGCLTALGGCVTPASVESTEEAAAMRSGSGSDETTTGAEAKAESSERSTAGVRDAATTDQEKLVADLNDASRELAKLRTAYARLRAERSAPAAPATAKSDPVDEKLSAALKSYGALKRELADIISEMERARAESAEAAAKLKDVSSRTDDSRATIARLERELRAEQKARIQAEQAVAKLQEQMRTIARALSSAGLSIDKLAGGGEAGGR